MRAVYDTNVLISIFLSTGVPKKVFMRVLKGDVGLLLSEQLLSEFKGVISRKKFGFSKYFLFLVSTKKASAARVTYLLFF